MNIVKIKGQYKLGTANSSGIDLYSVNDVYLSKGCTAILQTGVSVELPANMDAQIRPRSSMSKIGMLVHFGTIDNDYRGEIGVCMTNLTGQSITVNNGERIAQLVFSQVVPVVLEHVTTISTETERGEGGWGSTGK